MVPWAPFLKPVIGGAGRGSGGKGTRAWRLSSTSCWHLRNLVCVSLRNRGESLSRTQSLSGCQGGGPGVLPSGAAGWKGRWSESSALSSPHCSTACLDKDVPEQPGPLNTFPCPGLGCWCAEVWRDLITLKRHCTGHLGETEAVCYAHWGPPSRTLVQATLQ
jgi:hypothetical protein